MILGWVFGPIFGFNISSEDRDWFVDKHRLLRLEMAQDCEGVVRLQVCVQEEAFLRGKFPLLVADSSRVTCMLGIFLDLSLKNPVLAGKRQFMLMNQLIESILFPVEVVLEFFQGTADVGVQRIANSLAFNRTAIFCRSSKRTPML